METRKIINNFLWRFLERCGSQGITFIVSIILARLLEPEVYGTVTLVMVFVSILQVFVNSGFGTALIQKKNADDTDFSTVFYFNMVFSAVLYLLMCFLAPFIAAFYENAELIALIRALSLIIVVFGINNVQHAYVSKKLLFKKFFWSTLGGTIGGAAIGIYMAYMGYGVWALVGQQLAKALIDAIVLWITVNWRPKLLFSFKRLKGLFSFGWKLLVSSLIDTLYNDLRTLIIGKMYSSADLAFYNKGRTFPNMITQNINSSIDSVLLPTMSTAQDSKETVKAMTRRAIKTATYVMMPMMMGLAVCAEPFVKLLLTEKWMPCVPYLRIFCFVFAFYPMQTANLNAIKAMGRSDMFLRLEIIKKIIGLVLLLSSMWHSVMAMAYTLIISTIAGQIINSWPNKKLMGYSYLEQLKDISENIGLAVIMGAAVYLISLLKLPALVILVVQIVCGVIIYVVGSLVFKVETFNYLLKIIKSFLKRKKV